MRANTEQEKRIRWYLKSGYSANRIQKQLTKLNIGYERKALLADIRDIKHKPAPSKEVSARHVPKKYKRVKPKWVEPAPRKLEQLYRAVLIILDVPVHSDRKHNKPNYLGFRLLAFSSVEQNLNMGSLEDTLWREANKFVGADIRDWYDINIGKTYPTLYPVSNASMLDGRWIFTVEREGVEKYRKGGFI